METSFGSRTEEYYKKFIELQEKLRKSEEERLRLEMKFNEMVQVTREEEQQHYRKLRTQYKRFLEEDRRRQDRNERILRALERIESRFAVLKAKTERFKLLRQQYEALLHRIYKSRQQKLLEPTTEPKIVVEPPQIVVQPPKIQIPSLATDSYEKQIEEKSNILEQYLKNISSQKLRDEMKAKERTPFSLVASDSPEYDTKNEEDDLYSYGDGVFRPNYANSIAEDIMNSIYCRRGTGGVVEGKVGSIKQDGLNTNSSRLVQDSLRNLKGFEALSKKPEPVVSSFFNKGKSFEDSDSEDVSPNESNPSRELFEEVLRRKDQRGASDISTAASSEKIDSAGVESQLQNHGDQVFNADAKLDGKYPDSQSFNNELSGPQNILEENLKKTEESAKVDQAGTRQKYVIENSRPVVPQISDKNELLNRQLSREENLATPVIENKIPTTQFEEDDQKTNELSVVNSTENQPQVIECLEEDKPTDEKELPVEYLNQQYDQSAQEIQQYDESYPLDQQYNESGQPVQQYDEKEPQIPQYDESGQIIQQYDEGGQPLQQYIETGEPIQQYDDAGQPIQPYDDQQYGEQVQPILQYDTTGQPVQQYDEYGQPIQQYDEQGLPIQQYSDQQYDGDGQLIQQYDENGQPIQQYDENGQPIQQYFGNEVLEESGQIVPQYDENGQLIQQYDQYGGSDQMYDENGQPIQQYDESGQPVQQYADPSQSFQQYDENGQLIQQYEKDGQEILQYDEQTTSQQEYPQEYDTTNQLPATEDGQINRQPDQAIQQTPNQPQDFQQYDNDNQRSQSEKDVAPPDAVFEKHENLEETQPEGEKRSTPLPEVQDATKPKSNVMEMLDTDSESTKQDTKLSNQDSDFDFSNG